MEIDVRIAHLVARRAVANHEQNHVRGRSVDEPMGGPGPGRKASALAGRCSASPTASVSSSTSPLENVDELILSARARGGAPTVRPERYE